MYRITFLTRTGEHVTATERWGEKEYGAGILLLYNPEISRAEVKKFTFASLWLSTTIWIWIGWGLVQSDIDWPDRWGPSLVSPFFFHLLLWIGPLLLVWIVGFILFHFYRKHIVGVSEVAHRAEILRAEVALTKSYPGGLRWE